MTFDAANILTPEDLDIRISCGIDYGKVFIINNNDFFGNAVNVASKIGEDTASLGEVLVTKEAMGLVSDEGKINQRSIQVTISGIEINASSISYKQAST
jgi:adenylate cyclase